MLGLSVGSLLGGTSVVEIIFSYPGLGNLAVSAITSSDYNLIQGYVLWIDVYKRQDQGGAGAAP